MYDVVAVCFTIQNFLYAVVQKCISDKVKISLAVVMNLSTTILTYVAMEELVSWWKATVHIVVVWCLTVITVRYVVMHMIICLTCKIAITHVVVTCCMILPPKPAAVEEYARAHDQIYCYACLIAE